MSKNKEVKIKIESKIVKVKEGDKTDDYEIRTKGGAELPANFEKGCQKDELSKEDVAFEFRKKGTEKWNDFKSKVKWTGGHFFNSMELEKKELESGKTLEGTVELPTGFFGTPTIISWIGFVVIILSVVALIWWWVASSKSDDKEEESL